MKSKKAKISLRKKLSLGFLLAIIGSILISSIISNFMVGKRFNQYLADEQKTKVKNIVAMAQNLYSNESGFSSSNKDEIQRYAETQQLFIEIKDLQENVLFSSGNSYLQHNNNTNSMMGHMMGPMMHSFTSMQTGEYVEEKYSFVKNGQNLGYIVIGYFDSSYLTSEANAFHMTLNRGFVVSALIALLFGLIISVILSRQISFPLVNIMNTANKMRNGDLTVRSDTHTNTKEITELSDSINYLAETLQQQELLRKKLTSDMAHEIRTPLTTLKTHIEALMDGVWEPTQERFESFYEEIERLTKLVDNLRSLAKLEQASLNLIKTNFNLSKELEKIIDVFQPMYNKANFTIINKITPNINVFMDKDKVKQIMYNLLSNSFKYLNTGGTVQVELSKNQDTLILRVTDSGIGISAEDIPYIFERFYRSDSSRNKQTGGSGIGLTITKAIVEAHNGKIAVSSELGKGCIFTIEFPQIQ